MQRVCTSAYQRLLVVVEDHRDVGDLVLVNRGLLIGFPLSGCCIVLPAGGSRLTQADLWSSSDPVPVR